MKNYQESTFQIVGISAHISNEGNSAVQEIEALWERFWGEDVRHKIPDAASEDIYAVYTDYASDHTGSYTLLIGLPVNRTEKTPKDFDVITIGGDTYKRFTSKGKMPEAVLRTWMEIWADTSLDRAYRADFTVHGDKYFAGDDAEVETFISIND